MKICENCGCRVYKLGCVNCNEAAYIEQQEQLTATYATRDEHDNVLCPHGRPMSCGECGEDYARELMRPLNGPAGELSVPPRGMNTETSHAEIQPLRSAESTGTLDVLKPERWWEVYDWCRDIREIARRVSERVDEFANAIPDQRSAPAPQLGAVKSDGESEPLQSLCEGCAALKAQSVYAVQLLAGMEAQRDELLQELRNIADAKPRSWEPDMRDQFQLWAQNRARTAIAKAEGHQVIAKQSERV